MRHFGDVSANFWGSIWDLASLFLSLGGLGLRSSTVTSRPACWSSWADCLGMVQQRHPAVSRRIVHALNAITLLSFWQVSELLGHTWQLLGLSRRVGENLQMASGQSTLCWKWTGNQVSLVMVGRRTATVPIHGRQIEDSVRPRLPFSEQALFRSQGGPLSSVPFTCFSHLSVVSFPPPSECPSSPPLVPSLLPCILARVAVSLMSLATTGRVAQRQVGTSGVRFGLRGGTCVSRGRRQGHDKCHGEGFGLVANGPRRCPTSGGRRRWIALFHGAQVALETTLVSPLRRDGTPHARCAGEDGARSWMPTRGGECSAHRGPGAPREIGEQPRHLRLFPPESGIRCCHSSKW